MANVFASLPFSTRNINPAIVVPRRSRAPIITYQRLRADVLSFQAKLAALGISAGSAVSIVLPNSYEFIIAFLAISTQRAIAAPLNPGYKQDEFGFFIGDLNSSVVLVPQGTFGRHGEIIRAARNCHVAIAECYWNDHEIVLDLKDRGSLAGLAHQPIEMAKPDDIALILHTSGTTGKPKAVSSRTHSIQLLDTALTLY